MNFGLWALILNIKEWSDNSFALLISKLKQAKIEIFHAASLSDDLRLLLVSDSRFHLDLQLTTFFETGVQEGIRETAWKTREGTAFNFLFILFHQKTPNKHENNLKRNNGKHWTTYNNIGTAFENCIKIGRIWKTFEDTGQKCLKFWAWLAYKTSLNLACWVPVECIQKNPEKTPQTRDHGFWPPFNVVPSPCTYLGNEPEIPEVIMGRVIGISLLLYYLWFSSHLTLATPPIPLTRTFYPGRTLIPITSLL